MPQQIIRGHKLLLEEAEKVVEALEPEEVQRRAETTGAVLVDLRDPRELEREGKIAGAFHCPRGMLEFWIDPESPYSKPIFQEDRPFIFFCAGGWRSLLAARTAQEMGLKPVAHMRGGFGAWKSKGLPVAGGENKT
jgi:rhodanese-related sulfurtransferase